MAISKRCRKRKVEGEEDPEVKWELSNILSEELRDEMVTMWEIPQVFQFLQLSKDVINISHLSMYEVERMLAMPRASKQLANIMTSLLSPPMPKGKTRKIPPMPYEFWTNILTHKVKGWFKIYHSKHHDTAKVLEVTGVEPEFWNIISDASLIEEQEFDKLTFRQRVWILKSLCDTLLHTRKTIQEEIAKQFTDDQCEFLLGSDRYGAMYFYFPLFLNNDLRVYRHCIDNKILSTVKPPHVKEGTRSESKTEKNVRSRRKISRWKNGALPHRSRRSVRKVHCDNVDGIKLSEESELGSVVNDDTNLSNISECSNNNHNNIVTYDRNRSRSLSKASEVSRASGETRSSNPKSSGYDTNTSWDAKSVNGIEAEEMFRGFDNEKEYEDDSMYVICSILNDLTSKVSELIESESTAEDRATKEDSVIDLPYEQEDSDSNVVREKLCNTDREESPTDTGSDDANWSNKCASKNSKLFDKEALSTEIAAFSSLLADLGESAFELVADSVDSLRDLAASILANEAVVVRTKNSPVPRCEIYLARRMEDLVESLKDVETELKEATRKARNKLQREWTNFKDGVEEDRDASGDVDHRSNRWILGSQGSPLFFTSEAESEALSESPVPSPSPEIQFRTRSEQRAFTIAQSRVEDTDGNSLADLKMQTIEEKLQDNEGQKGIDEIKREKTDTDENNDAEYSKTESEPKTRRVLRARGIPSYIEQFSSDEEDAYELEEWPRVETVNTTSSASDGTSAPHASAKTGQVDDDSEEKNSDQDWILPRARKRKNKRSPANRRLKSTTSGKSQNPTSDSHESSSTLSPSSSATAIADLSNKMSIPEDSEAATVSSIFMMDSVHSELDIKDEKPIFDFNVNNEKTASAENTDDLNSYHDSTVTPAVHRYQIPTQPSVPEVPQTTSQMQSSYYAHVPQNYYQLGSDPRYMQYTYPQMLYNPPQYPFQQPNPYQYPAQNNDWQYPTQPVYYPRSARPPRYPPQRGHPNPPIPQVPSTTLYSARMPSKGPPNRMPVPRLSAIQQNGYAVRGPGRPIGSINQSNVRPQGPRSAGRPGPRMVRANRTNVNSNNNSNSSPEKTTSVILLSDSDDEIEMIVPEKRNAPATKGNDRRNVGKKKTKQQLPSTRTKPVVTSEITVPKSSEILSPQMIQRMSQGGISITPVKPPPTKPETTTTTQGTKLVVVVNETGNHYALALPNGSKLILTPEQVAQIRASNGGKLVL